MSRPASGRALGPNGAGKTTLTRTAVGCGARDRAGNGGRLGRRREAPRRDGVPVGYAFQHADQQLFARTVPDDVAFGPRQLGRSDGWRPRCWRSWGWPGRRGPPVRCAARRPQLVALAGVLASARGAHARRAHRRLRWAVPGARPRRAPGIPDRGRRWARRASAPRAASPARPRAPPLSGRRAARRTGGPRRARPAPAPPAPRAPARRSDPAAVVRRPRPPARPRRTAADPRAGRRTPPAPPSRRGAWRRHPSPPPLRARSADAPGPMAIRVSVVLPAPLGPESATDSPAAT